MKKTILLSACILALVSPGMQSCGDDSDYIPERIKPVEPEPEPEDNVFNEFDFPVHKDGEKFDTYRGLVMAGYQGWFGTPGDGCKHNDSPNTVWYHYRENETFEPGVLNNSIDLWPDMSEYEVKYDAPFYYPDGSQAQVYSAYDESSVLLHFKWMKEYNIDGVFMQRFVGEVLNNPAGKDHFDKVMQSAMKGSNQYQRAICVMYDLGGYNTSDGNYNTDALLADLSELNAKYNFTNRDAGQKFYLYENGRPVVAIWGVGFPDKTPAYFSMSDISNLIDRFNEMGFSVMLGVPTYWRVGGGDTISPLAQLTEVIKKADIIMPWLVGRFGYASYADHKDRIAGDIKWCKDNNIVYAPLCLPGATDLHMHPQYGPNEGRYGGQFFWNQIYHSVKSGAEALYIAMFDEIDEGTAIYKVLNQKDVPSNVPTKDYWILYKDGSPRKRSTEYTGELLPGEWQVKASEIGKGIPYNTGDPEGIPFYGIEDNLPTDHYLWLTGAARKMLNGEIRLSESLPARE
ncbi:MAG: xylosidase [Muribaculaceae bacterium]|nr:xylosidase [Muribaculaceae bacterium]